MTSFTLFDMMPRGERVSLIRLRSQIISVQFNNNFLADETCRVVIVDFNTFLPSRISMKEEKKGF